MIESLLRVDDILSILIIRPFSDLMEIYTSAAHGFVLEASGFRNGNEVKSRENRGIRGLGLSGLCLWVSNRIN